MSRYSTCTAWLDIQKVFLLEQTNLLRVKCYATGNSEKWQPHMEDNVADDVQQVCAFTVVLVRISSWGKYSVARQKSDC